MSTNARIVAEIKKACSFARDYVLEEEGGFVLLDFTDIIRIQNILWPKSTPQREERRKRALHAQQQREARARKTEIREAQAVLRRAGLL